MGQSYATIAFLVPISAGAYALATFGIKMASGTVTPAALFLIVLGFVLAAASEAILLRHSDLGVIYLSVIAIETLVILAITSMIGEGLSGQQLAGAAFVFGGIVLVGLE